MVDHRDNGDTLLAIYTPGTGCALILAAANVAVMGLVALCFGSLTYHSAGQMTWYRLGSLGFLTVGGIVPGILLLTRGRRSPIIRIVTVVVMLITVPLFFAYLLLSGGGI